MGVFLVWAAMGRPSRVPNAQDAGERPTRKNALKVFELANGSPPHQLATFKGRDASGIVSSIFQTL